MEGLPQSDSDKIITHIWPDETDHLFREINAGLSGNIHHIAIISEFLAGREELISAAAQNYKGRVTRISLTETLHDLSLLSHDSGADIIIVENCRFIFHRMINGFHLLDEFIAFVSRCEKIWITTWNIHSWRYLSAVKDIGSLFVRQIELTRKSEAEMKDILLSHQHSSPLCTIDTTVPRRMILIRKQKSFSIPFFQKELTYSYYKLRLRLLLSLLRNKREEIDPSELIFERIYQISHGNPGLALKIWNEACDSSGIRINNLAPPSVSGVSDHDMAYILSLIVTYEDVIVSDLVEELPSDIDLNRIISKLRGKGLVILKNGRIQVNPIAAVAITKELKRIRMVW